MMDSDRVLGAIGSLLFLTGLLFLGLPAALVVAVVRSKTGSDITVIGCLCALMLAVNAIGLGAIVILLIRIVELVHAPRA